MPSWLPGGLAGIIGFSVGAGIGNFFFPGGTNILGQFELSPEAFVFGIVGLGGAILIWENR